MNELTLCTLNAKVHYIFWEISFLYFFCILKTCIIPLETIFFSDGSVLASRGMARLDVTTPLTLSSEIQYFLLSYPCGQNWYSANHYSTQACHSLTNRYIGLTLVATWATLCPLLCQISNLFPVTVYLQIRPFTSRVQLLDPLGAVLLFTVQQHPGSSWLRGGGGELLIVISQANDLWSIFRPEPQDWGGSGPFSWMTNKAVVSTAQDGPHRIKSMQSPPPRLG